MAAREDVDIKDVVVEHGRLPTSLALHGGSATPPQGGVVEIGNRDALFMGSRPAIGSEK